MTISFLQLNTAKRPKEFVDKYMESESLGTLLMDFFLYYGKMFPYRTHYISVSEGKLCAKNQADWINDNPSNRLAVQCLVKPGRSWGDHCSFVHAK
jgi:DNA polymerase sigma